MNTENNYLSSVLTAINKGQNILLHSPGGCGKTYTLREIAISLTDNEKTFACTATTGVAAINLNIPKKKIAARTLHSWAGIGVGRNSKEKLLSKVLHKKMYRDRWLNTDILIIDEISI